MLVATFEWIGQRLELISESDSLKVASAALPEGAYTTFRTYHRRRILRLAQHGARLEESAALKGTPALLDPSLLRRAVAEALDRVPHEESRLRVTFAPPRLLVSVEPFVPLPPSVYERGAECVTLRLRRETPQAKDTRFIATAQAAYASLPPGVEEGLMLDDAGVVLEGLSSNFFAVKDGRLWTEEKRVLAGVTRAIVLEVAARVLPVSLTGVALDPTVKECFITSVSREVLPVTRIDGQPVGDRLPGKATREIAGLFADLVAREAEEV